MGLAETKKMSMGKTMDNRGDFNDIIGLEDKQGGRRRLESSFMPFRAFINTMEMEVGLSKGGDGHGLMIGLGKVSLRNAWTWYLAQLSG